MQNETTASSEPYGFRQRRMSEMRGWICFRLPTDRSRYERQRAYHIICQAHAHTHTHTHRHAHGRTRLSHRHEHIVLHMNSQQLPQQLPSPREKTYVIVTIMGRVVVVLTNNYPNNYPTFSTRPTRDSDLGTSSCCIHRN